MSSLGSSPRPKQYDPDSNVYVAGLPRNFNKDKLHQLFNEYGDILRYKFVSPKDDTKCPYGFVQFSIPSEAQDSIKALNGKSLPSGETIEVSIAAVGRRASPSEEPTNLYIENMPNSWNNEQLTKVFGRYGTIVQSKITGNNVAFVRFETHQQALNAINALHKTSMDSEGRTRLTVRFATCQHKKSTNLNIPNSSRLLNSCIGPRSLNAAPFQPSVVTTHSTASYQQHTDYSPRGSSAGSPPVGSSAAAAAAAAVAVSNAANSLRSRHSAGFYGGGSHHHSSHSNENNLYIKHLPKSYNQSILERFFEKFGPISSATIINDSVGVAFVRFKNAEDARRAIKELNGTKPPEFDKEIIVKLAHSDIDQQQQQQQQHQSINHALQHNGLHQMDQLSLQQQVFNNYQMQQAQAAQQQHQQHQANHHRAAAAVAAVAAAAAAQHQHHTQHAATQHHHHAPHAHHGHHGGGHNQQQQPHAHSHHQLGLPNHPHFQWATNLPYNMYNSNNTQQMQHIQAHHQQAQQQQQAPQVQAVAASSSKNVSKHSTLRVTAPPFFNPSSNTSSNITATASSNGYTTDNTVNSAYSPHSTAYDHNQNVTISLPDIPHKEHPPLSSTVSSFHSKAGKDETPHKPSNKGIQDKPQSISLINGFLRSHAQQKYMNSAQKAVDLLLQTDKISNLIASHFCGENGENAQITDDTFKQIMEGFSMSNANDLPLSNDELDDIVKEVDRALSHKSKSDHDDSDDDDDEFGKLSVQVHDLENRFSAMQTKIDNVCHKLSGHKRHNEESRQYELNLLHSQFNQSVKSLHSRIEQHMVSIRDRIDRQHQSMSQRMSKMQRQIDELDRGESSSQYKLDQNEQDIDAVDVGVECEDEYDIENVKRWLTQTVRVSSSYVDIFIQNGYDDMESIRDITDSELMKIGITKIGHRKKILKYAAKIIDGDAAATNSAFHPFLLTALDNETALSTKSNNAGNRPGTAPNNKSKFFAAPNDQQSNGSSADFGCFSTMEPATNWMCHHSPSRSRNESPSNTYNTSETI